MTPRNLAALAAVAATIAGCGEPTTTAGLRSEAAVGGAAEAACQRAVSANTGGGASSVVGSEPAGSGTVVTARSGDGTLWRCATSETGVVSQLSAI